MSDHLPLRRPSWHAVVDLPGTALRPCAASGPAEPIRALRIPDPCVCAWPGQAACEGWRAAASRRWSRRSTRPRSEVMLETYIFEFRGIGAPGGRGAGARGRTRRRRARGGRRRRHRRAARPTGASAGPRPACAGACSTRRAAGACCCPGAGGACTASCASSTAAMAFCGGINLLDDLLRSEPRHARPAAAGLRGARHRAAGGRRARHDDAPVAAPAGGARSAPARRRRRAAGGARRGAGRHGAARAPARRAERGAVAALVLRDNVRYRRRIEATYRVAIAQARREILIANAYFVPGVRLQRALLRAARRGVQGHAAAAGALRILHAVPRQPRGLRRRC